MQGQRADVHQVVAAAGSAGPGDVAEAALDAVFRAVALIGRLNALLRRAGVLGLIGGVVAQLQLVGPVAHQYQALNGPGGAQRQHPVVLEQDHRVVRALLRQRLVGLAVDHVVDAGEGAAVGVELARLHPRREDAHQRLVHVVLRHQPRVDGGDDVVGQRGAAVGVQTGLHREGRGLLAAPGGRRYPALFRPPGVVVDYVAQAVAVGDHIAVKAPRPTQHIVQNFLAHRHRHAVDCVVRGHDGLRLAVFNGVLECVGIVLPQVPLVDVGRAGVAVALAVVA